MTLSDVTTRRYRRHRADGLGAKVALDISRAQTADRPDLDTDSPHEWERDGFTLRASVEHDEGYDASWLGEFTDRRPDDCTQTGAGEDRYPRYEVPATWGPAGELLTCTHQEFPRGAHDRECRYIALSQYDHAEERAAHSRDGMARHQADLAARQTKRDLLATLERWGRGEAGGVCVSVTASRAGVELGRAGCGTDAGFADDPADDRENWWTLAQECATEAIENARDALGHLCAAD